MKVFAIAFIILLSLPASAQEDSVEDQSHHLFTLGILNGGGSLIGLDYEHRLGPQFGIQVGAGLVGFGAGLHYHLEPVMNSSAVSFQFWNQGTSGNQLSQRVAGFTYLYRSATSGLTGQLGLGYVLETGKLMADYYRNKNIANPPKIILLYSLGWYFY